MAVTPYTLFDESGPIENIIPKKEGKITEVFNEDYLLDWLGNRVNARYIELDIMYDITNRRAFILAIYTIGDVTYSKEYRLLPTYSLN